MGGRGTSSYSIHLSFGGAGETPSPISSLQLEAQQLSDIFDLLKPEEREVIIGLNADQLEAVGIDPRLAFLLSAQGLGEDQLRQMLANAANIAPDTYRMITPESVSAGGVYPFLELNNRNWVIIMRDIPSKLANPDNDIDDYLPAIDPAHNFGMTEPTLRWIKDGKIVDVFVDGMSMTEFTKSIGLDITMPKGEAVTGKRLSRIFRDYKVSSFMPSSSVNMRVMTTANPHEALVWDGAGVMSRKMLTDLAIAQGVPADKLADLINQADNGSRVEFTLVNAQGEYKGHAIIADNLDVDFLLPDDVKTDVKLTNGTTFIGVNFVHGNSTMNLDVQSLVNMHPFLNPANLRTYMEAEGDLYLSGIDSGQMAETLQRIQPNASVDDITRWSVLEYYARGGDPTWFRTPISSVIGQHLDKLEFSLRDKVRFPVPGSRYYVMPDAIARAAGKPIAVPRGEIYIDPDTATAWVNSGDWTKLEDLPLGLRDIWGGADNDNSLWLHSFHDLADDQNKIVAWRSPNEPGDYAVLKPMIGSTVAPFHTPNGDLTYPNADSSQFPPRRDQQHKTYLGYVEEGDGSNLGKGQPYSIPIMDLAIRQEATNASTLGMYVNTLMIHKLVFGKLPDTLPAPLEDIVDASAKTGANLWKVKNWIGEEGAELLQFGIPIPETFQKRLAVPPQDKDKLPPMVTSKNNWMDQLLGVVNEHIATVETRAEALRREAQAPPALFDAVFRNPEDVYLGSDYNQTYNAALKKAEANSGKGTPKAHAAAQLAAEAFLSKYPEEKQRAILRGSLVSTQMSEKNTSDAAAWLQPHRAASGRQKTGVAQKTIAALTEIGILGDLKDVISTDANGRQHIQALATPPPQRAERKLTMITLSDATAFELKTHGHDPSKADKKLAEAARQRIDDNTRTNAYDDLTVVVRHEVIRNKQRAVLTTGSGTPLGLLPEEETWRPDDKEYTIAHAIRQGNSLRIILK